VLQSFTPSTDLGFLEATETGLRVTYVMSLLGSIVSVLVGIVASVCYSGILALHPRPPIDPLFGSPFA